MDKEKIRLSIIAPVYNVAPFLTEFVESIIIQKFSSRFELILVDDGSTDESSVICDNYSDKYDFIRTIHQKNGGLSNARNTGLRFADGDYIVFADSDDCWNDRFLASIDQILEKEPDICVFGAERFDEHGVIGSIASPVIPNGESGERYLQELFNAGYGIIPYAWIYIYKRELLLKNDIWFIDGQASSEDFEFNMKCIPLAKSIIGTQNAIYRYRIRNGSLSSTLSKEKYLANLVSKTKYYRIYPNETMANIWAWNVFQIGRLENKNDILSMQKYIEENKDIFRFVTQKRLIICKYIYSIFGVYKGSKICTKLANIKKGIFR